MELDHIAISGQTRDAATQHVAQLLGVPLQMGGEHPHFGTHNTLLGLEDGLYLEAIAVDPAAAPLPHARWFGLDAFAGEPRLTNWICRVDDLEAVVAALPDAGEIVALTRGDLRWRMAVPQDGMLPYQGMFPALIQWDGPHPAPRLTQQGVALTALRVFHPQVSEIAQALQPWLNAPLIEFLPGPARLEADFETPQGKVTLR
ncbi:VOC family protein [Primorskyibacter sp. S187A]|uniref:VOC family protein n=1 Tax=Primorskyibacter sp. S187A TaxID=3415130 RepID=UPI003C7AB078